jgi:hypothetical protein
LLLVKIPDPPADGDNSTRMISLSYKLGKVNEIVPERLPEVIVNELRIPLTLDTNKRKAKSPGLRNPTVYVANINVPWY